MPKKRTARRPPKPENAVQRSSVKKDGGDKQQPVEMSKWLQPLANAISKDGPAFLKNSTDDTTAVITATEIISSVLQLFILLHAGRVPTTAHLESLFKNNAPLATFSSKIYLCFLMGHILPDMKFDLDIVRKLRNDFCHSVVGLSFADPSVSISCSRLRSRSMFNSDLAGALKSTYGEPSSPAKEAFIANVIAILILLLIMLARRIAQIQVSAAHSEEINQIGRARLSELLKSFGPQVEKAAESASQRHPPESTLPENSEQAPVPSPPSSPG